MLRILRKTTFSSFFCAVLLLLYSCCFIIGCVAPPVDAPYKGYITVPAQTPTPTYTTDGQGRLVVTAPLSGTDYAIPDLLVIFTLANGDPLSTSEPTYTAIKGKLVFSTVGWLSPGWITCTTTDCSISGLGAPTSKFTTPGDYVGYVQLKDTDPEHHEPLVLRVGRTLTATLMPTPKVDNFKFNLSFPSEQSPPAQVKYGAHGLYIVQTHFVANQSGWAFPSCHLQFVNHTTGEPISNDPDDATIAPIQASLSVAGGFGLQNVSCTATGCSLPAVVIPSSIVQSSYRLHVSITINTVPPSRVQLSASFHSDQPVAVGTVNPSEYNRIVMTNGVSLSCFISSVTGTRVQPSVATLAGTAVTLFYNNGTFEWSVGNGIIDRQNMGMLKWNETLAGFSYFKWRYQHLAAGEYFHGKLIAKVVDGPWAALTSEVALPQTVAFPQTTIIMRQEKALSLNISAIAKRLKPVLRPYRVTYGLCSTAPSRSISIEAETVLAGENWTRAMVSSVTETIWFVSASRGELVGSPIRTVKKGDLLRATVRNVTVGKIVLSAWLQSIFDGTRHHPIGGVLVNVSVYVSPDVHCCTKSPLPVVATRTSSPPLLAVQALRGCSSFHPAIAMCPSSEEVRIELVGDGLAAVSNVSFVDQEIGIEYACVTVVVVNDTLVECNLPKGVSGHQLRVLVRDNMNTTFSSFSPTASFTSAGHSCPFSNVTNNTCGLGRCERWLGECNCSGNSAVQGPACDVCGEGRYGSNCASECPRSASSGAICDGRGVCDGLNGNGTCICDTGYSGVACEFVCPGSGPANCNGHGRCDSSTNGTCVCDPRWNGTTCNVCADGYSGAECHLECPRATSGDSCNSVGVCMNGACRCNQGYCGIACEQSVGSCPPCPVGYFGVQCDQQCPGPHGQPCNNQGSCDDGQLGSGLCQCDSGFGGPACELVCPQQGGSLCSGHGNCLAATATCECDTWYAGVHCSKSCPKDNNGTVCAGHGHCSDGAEGSGVCECFDGYYSATCALVCNSCNGHGNCNTTNGNCECNRNLQEGFWAAEFCDQCLSGWGGSSCTKQCPTSVENSLVCSGHGTCNSEGTCTCWFNPSFGYWVGTQCNECHPSAWGSDCTNLCPGASDPGQTNTEAGCPPCGGNGICNNGRFGNGTCSCATDNSSGWWSANSNCTQCQDGVFGLFCTNHCPTDDVTGSFCGKGQCSDGVVGDGSCQCDDGWTTNDESTSTTICNACVSGRFGSHCNLLCPGLENTGVICSGHGSCDDGTDGSGDCKCDAGFSGASCNASCPIWIDDVVCGEHGTCDSTSQSCVCDEGFAPNDNENGTCTSCANGYFGSDCEPCACENNATCSSGIDGDGSCACSPSFWGVHCENICIATPGTNNKMCSGHGECSPEDGLCVCHNDATNGFWTGEWCSECQTPYLGSRNCNVSCPTDPSNGLLCGGRGTCAEGVCTDCTLQATDANKALICGQACDVFDEQCNTECPKDAWGPPACEGACPKCLNGGVCDEQTGLCSCTREFSGSQCQDACDLGTNRLPCSGRGICDTSGCLCEYGFFGTTCQHECPGGASNPCLGHGQCNPASGLCVCHVGFVGSECEFECPGSVPATPTSAPTTCNGAGTCSTEFTGNTLRALCTCNASVMEGSYSGHDCSQCASGYSGPQCTDRCLPSHGQTVGRSCRCFNGRAGPTCDLTCPGLSTADICSGHGQCRDGHNGDGTCVCNLGFYGPSCDVACSVSQCRASNLMEAPQCNTTTGACECQQDATGWFTGPKCDECMTFWWGPTCALRCLCNDHGGCDRNTGECRCFDDDLNGHWTGYTCDRCADGFIGLQCQRRNIQMSTSKHWRIDVRPQRKDGALILMDDQNGLAYFGSQPVAVVNTTTGKPAVLDNGLSYLDLGGAAIVGTLMDDKINFIVEHISESGVFVYESVQIPRAGTIGQSTDDITHRRVNPLNAAPPPPPPTTTTPGKAIAVLPLPSTSTSATPLQYVIVLDTLMIVDTRTVPSSQHTIPSYLLSKVSHAFITANGTVILSGSQNGVWAIVIFSAEALLVNNVSWSTFNQENTLLGACTAETDTKFGGCQEATFCIAMSSKNRLLCGLASTDGPMVISLPFTEQNETVTDPPQSSLLVDLSSHTNLRFTAMGVDTGAQLLYAAFDHSGLPSNIYKLDVASLATTGAMELGGDVGNPEIALSIKIRPETREVFVAIVLDYHTELRGFNMFGVERVVPEVVDSRGGTTVTVLGEGFLPFAQTKCVFGDARHAVIRPAFVQSERVMLCRAPEATSTFNACGGTAFNVQFGTRSTTTTNVFLLQSPPAALHAVQTDFGAHDAFGGSTLRVRVMLTGVGFVRSNHAACRLVAESSGLPVFRWETTFINSTNVECLQPPRPGHTSPFPSYLQYSHDGVQFSTSNVVYAVVGSGFGLKSIIRGVANDVHIKVNSGEIAIVPTFEVHVIDIAGNSLRWLDDPPHGTGPHELRAEALPPSLSVEKHLQFAGNISQRQVTTKAGVGVFQTLQLLRPPMGTYTVIIRTVNGVTNDWETHVSLDVLEGLPSRVELVRPYELDVWRFGSYFMQPLVPSVVAQVVDAAGNRVRDSRNAPTALVVQFVRETPDEENGLDFRTTTVKVPATFENGEYVFPNLLTQVRFGSSPTIEVHAEHPNENGTKKHNSMMSIISSLKVPILVERCDSAYYGVRGTFECRLCPPEGICDGSTTVLPRPGYWQPATQHPVFHSCKPPFAADTCRAGQCVGPYTGPRCSVCVEGHARSGLECVQCNSRAVNAVLMALLLLFVVAVSLLFVSQSVKQPLMSHETGQKDPTLLVLRILGNHLQVSAKVALTLLEPPPQLSGFFNSQQRMSTIELNFAFIECESGFTFYSHFVSMMFVPIALFVICAVAMVIRNEAKQRKSAAQLAAEEEEDIIQRNIAASREEFFSPSIFSCDAIIDVMSDVFPNRGRGEPATRVAHDQQEEQQFTSASLSRTPRVQAPGALFSRTQSMSERSLLYLVQSASPAPQNPVPLPQVYLSRTGSGTMQNTGGARQRRRSSLSPFLSNITSPIQGATMHPQRTMVFPAAVATAATAAPDVPEPPQVFDSTWTDPLGDFGSSAVSPKANGAQLRNRNRPVRERSQTIAPSSVIADGDSQHESEDFGLPPPRQFTRLFKVPSATPPSQLTPRDSSENSSAIVSMVDLPNRRIVRMPLDHSLSGLGSPSSSPRAHSPPVAPLPSGSINTSHQTPPQPALTRRTIREFMNEIDSVAPPISPVSYRGRRKLCNTILTPNSLPTPRYHQTKPAAVPPPPARRDTSSQQQHRHQKEKKKSSPISQVPTTHKKQNTPTHHATTVVHHVPHYELDWQQRTRKFREEPLFFNTLQVILVVLSVVLFFFYLPVIETCTKMLQCETLQDGPESHIEVLTADRRIDCTSDEYRRYQVVAVLTMLVLGVGYPVACVALIRAYATASPLPQCANDPAQSWRQTRRLFYFLTGGYKWTHWWWEVIGLMRRGSIAIMVVTVENVQLRNYTCMWIVGGCLAAQLHMQPFNEQMLSNLETLSLTTVFLTLNGAALINTLSQEQDRAAVSLVLLVVNIGCLLVFGVIFMKAALTKLRSIHLNNPQLLPFLGMCFLSDNEESERQVTNEIRHQRQELVELDLKMVMLHRKQTEREDFILGAIDMLEKFNTERRPSTEAASLLTDDQEEIETDHHQDCGTLHSLANHFSPAVRRWHLANEHFVMQTRLLEEYHLSQAVLDQANELLRGIFIAERQILEELLVRQKAFNLEVAKCSPKNSGQQQRPQSASESSFWVDVSSESISIVVWENQS